MWSQAEVEEACTARKQENENTLRQVERLSIKRVRRNLRCANTTTLAREEINKCTPSWTGFVNALSVTPVGDYVMPENAGKWRKEQL